MKFSVLTLLLFAASAVFGSSSVRSIANADIIQMTHENYNSVMKSDKPLVIDINASWCGACKMMNPVIDTLSEEYKDTVLFAKIDYDSQHELVQKYEIAGLPTILFFKAHESEPYTKATGALSAEQMREKISELLK